MYVHETGTDTRKLNDEQRRLAEDNHALIYVALSECCKPDEREEYYGVAAEGLCKAARTWDSSRGVRFSTYAVKCMVNECLCAKRKQFGAQKRGCGSVTISLSDPVAEGSSLCIEDTLSSCANFVEDNEKSNSVRSAIRKLEAKYNGMAFKSDIDRLAIFKYVCIEHIGQKEVAAKFGISQTYVSRIASKVKSDLAAELRSEGIYVIDRSKNNGAT